MKQQDYAPRQNFRRVNVPMGQPQMRQPMQPAQQNFSRQPQPMMQGGNFAPRPGNPQQMMGRGMFGPGNYQQNNDTMPGYEGAYNTNDWQNIKLGDVRDQWTQQQAEDSVGQMDQFMDSLNGEVDFKVDTGAVRKGDVGKVTSAMSMVIGLLNDVDSWIPGNVAPQKIATLKDKGGIVAKQLTIFKNALAQLDGK